MCSFTYHSPFFRRLVWCSSAEVRGRHSAGRHSHRRPQQQNRRPARLIPIHGVDVRPSVCCWTPGTIDIVQSRHAVFPFIPVSACSCPVFALSPSSRSAARPTLRFGLSAGLHFQNVVLTDDGRADSPSSVTSGS